MRQIVDTIALCILVTTFITSVILLSCHTMEYVEEILVPQLENIHSNGDTP